MGKQKKTTPVKQTKKKTPVKQTKKTNQNGEPNVQTCLPGCGVSPGSATRLRPAPQDHLRDLHQDHFALQDLHHRDILAEEARERRELKTKAREDAKAREIREGGAGGAGSDCLFSGARGVED